MESFIFLGMNLNMWIVLLTILVVFGLMLFNVSSMNSEQCKLCVNRS